VKNEKIPPKENWSVNLKYEVRNTGF
jgi:hypothetical protein